jgi:hypothetical protein
MSNIIENIIFVILIRIVFFYCDRFNKFLSEKSLINVAKSITDTYNFTGEKKNKNKKSIFIWKINKYPTFKRVLVLLIEYSW